MKWLQDLQRFWRLAEFRLLCLALALVTAAMTAVGSFSERVEQGLQSRTSAIFGADAIIESTRPLDPDYINLAKASGLRTAQSISFMSMLVTENGSHLAGVRSVSENYPLRGEIVLQNTDGSSEVASGVPAPGTIWVASQLATEVEFNAPGAVLGDSDFVPLRQIALEPEGGAGMLRLTPRVLMNMQDLAATGLVTPASRARFRLLLAGEAETVRRFTQALEPELKSYESLQLADIRQSDVQGTIGRVVSYLRLAVLLSVVLAIVAMALSAQGLWRRQSHEVALLRCLGKAHGEILWRVFSTYLVAAIPVGAVGVVAGIALQSFAVDLVQSNASVELPPATLQPAAVAFVISIVTLLGVMLPILFSLKRIPAIEVLRTRQTDLVSRDKLAGFSIVTVVVAIALVLARDTLLALSVVGGLIAAALLLWLVLRLVIHVGGRLMPPGTSVGYQAVRAITSNSGRSAWLASAFGATVFALMLLGVIRNDLFEAWERSVPADAPNLFFINIQDADLAPLSRLLAESDASSSGMYPIIRGRIVALNGESIRTEEISDERTRRRINHEFNLTELSELPEENSIVAGAWFRPGEVAWSVEQDTAEILGVKLGDRLTVDVGGQQVDAAITSIRSVRWDTMRPNFFIIASSGLFADMPRHYITSVYAQEHRNQLVREVTRNFPGVTAIDLDMLLQRFRSLADQASTAVGSVFVFTLATALLVLIGVLQGQRSARLKEIALQKTLGANRGRIRNGVLLEFLLLGGLAGALGAGLAFASGWVLAREVFEFSYQPAWRWLPISMIATGVLVAIAGFLSVRKLLTVPPVRLLARN